MLQTTVAVSQSVPKSTGDSRLNIVIRVAASKIIEERVEILQFGVQVFDLALQCLNVRYRSVGIALNSNGQCVYVIHGSD